MPWLATSCVLPCQYRDLCTLQDRGCADLFGIAVLVPQQGSNASSAEVFLWADFQFDTRNAMSNQVNRRAFVQQAAGAVTGGVVACTSFWSRPARAIEPIARNGEAKFKFSMAAYSYRQLLQGTPPALTLADFIDDCARFGLEGTELTSYYFPKPVTPAYLRQLKRQCFRLGLDISGTAVGNNFALPDGPQRDEQIGMVKQWVDYAEILGAPVIRVFAGYPKKGMAAEQAHKRIVAGLEQCCQYAGEHGIHLALENHGGPTADVDKMLSLVHDVKSPWFGVNLDSGNFRSDDIYGDLARIAPFTINVQIKVSVAGPDGKNRPSDFQRLARILRDAGYRGYIVLEYEEQGDIRQQCARYVRQIREAFSAKT